MKPRSAALLLVLAPPAFVGLVRAEPLGLVRQAASGSASVGRPAPRHQSVGFAPDPRPLVTKTKWVYEITVADGAFVVPSPTKRELARPTETERKMGRFMLELYIGSELVDRVRFDVPLMNGDPFTGQKRRPFSAPPDFEKRVRAKIKVEVPDAERATSALIVDRATGKTTRIPWPRAGVDAIAPSASTSASAAPAPPAAASSAP